MSLDSPVLCRFVVRVIAISLLILVTLTGMAQTETGGTPAIDVTETVVTVSNVRPGGAVVLFTCARTSRNGRSHFERQAQVLRDDDKDGSVRYTPESGVPLRSVWIAVDYESGGSAAGAHPAFPLRTEELEVSAFRKDAEQGLAELVQDIPRLVLLVVRPGTGVWTLLAHDGGEGDSDRSLNARLTMAFASARTVEGKHAAPKHLKAGDVVVTVTPGHLDVRRIRIVE